MTRPRRQFAFLALVAVALIAAVGREDLKRAIESGDLESVRRVVEQKPKLLRERLGMFDCSPLAYAVSHGSGPVVAYLIERGLDPHEKVEDSRTLLHHASHASDATVVDVLVDRGLDVNAHTSESLDTPLHLAAYRTNLPVMRVLIAREAAVNAANRLLRTPLHLAARNGNLEAVRLLLDGGADPELIDGFGHDAAAAAMSRGHDELGRLLTEIRLVRARDRGEGSSF